MKEYKRYIIWTDKIKDGNQFLEQIIEEYKQKNIEIYYCRKTKSEFTVVFENENTIDTWRVKLAAEFNRAQRADISLVNTNISLEIFNTIIRPQTYLTYYPDNIMYWNPMWSKRCKYVN